MIGTFVEFKDSNNKEWSGIILDKIRDIAYYPEANVSYAQNGIKQPIFHVVDYYLIHYNNQENIIKVKPSAISKILKY